MTHRRRTRFVTAVGAAGLVAAVSLAAPAGPAHAAASRPATVVKVLQ